MTSSGPGRTYDAVAGAYEQRFENELVDKPFDRRLLEHFAAVVGDPVVEVGAGPGQVGAYLRRHERRVVGVDLSHQMSRLAARRLDASVTADLRRLPIAPGRAGGVLAFYSVIHLPRSELAPALAELGRALRPGGRLLLAAHEGRDELEVDEFLGQPVSLVVTFFTLDELVTATNDAGLEVVDTHRRDPYPAEHPTMRLYLEARRP